MKWAERLRNKLFPQPDCGAQSLKRTEMSFEASLVVVSPGEISPRKHFKRNCPSFLPKISPAGLATYSNKN